MLCAIYPHSGLQRYFVKKNANNPFNPTAGNTQGPRGFPTELDKSTWWLSHQVSLHIPLYGEQAIGQDPPKLDRGDRQSPDQLRRCRKRLLVHSNVHCHGEFRSRFQFLQINHECQRSVFQGRAWLLANSKNLQREEDFQTLLSRKQDGTRPCRKKRWGILCACTRFQLMERPTLRPIVMAMTFFLC